MAGRSGAIDMTRGRPISLMLRFALPMMLGSVFQSLYTMVDSAVLGRYVGSEALAAVGATTSTTNFILLLSTGVTSAVSIVISQFVGAGDEKKIRAGLVSTVYLTLGIGAAMCVVSMLLNVALDLLSVLVFELGVAGVASATVIAQAVSAAVCIAYMFKKHPQLRLKKDDFKPDTAVLLRIFGMGAQMALQGALLSVGMMVITRVINGFGANVVAAFTVGSNVQNLAVMLFSNFSFGFSVYVGQNFGARLAGRIRRGVREIFLLVGGLSVLASALSLIFAEPLVLLYVKPEETQVIEASLSFVRIQSWFFPFLGWIWLYNSTLKGMGKIGVTMISSFVELGSKIGLSILLPIWIGYTGIWFSAPIGWILGLIPNLIYYYGGFWQRALPPLPEDAPAEPSPEAAG